MIGIGSVTVWSSQPTGARIVTTVNDFQVRARSISGKFNYTTGSAPEGEVVTRSVIVSIVHAGERSKRKTVGRFEMLRMLSNTPRPAAGSNDGVGSITAD